MMVKCDCIKRRKYFEGWYFKHQKDRNTIILIPGYTLKGTPYLLSPINQLKEKYEVKWINLGTNTASPRVCDTITGKVTNMEQGDYAFIQVITNDNSFFVKYDLRDCDFSKDRLSIKIGETIFCRQGIKVKINTDKLKLKGNIRYEAFTPIRYSIMGPFLNLPFMECKHEIISMYHKVFGRVVCNGQEINFDEGVGYIEKDWGHSFPKSYVWFQCNHFQKEKCSVVVSIARIPYLGVTFSGCICAITYKGFEYRLATYLGVKIINYDEKEICLKQGKYLLKIELYPVPSAESKGTKGSYSLFAPKQGSMSRTIEEQVFCKTRVRFYEGYGVLFDLKSEDANMEYVKE